MVHAFRGTSGDGWAAWDPENTVSDDGVVTLATAPPTYVDPTQLTDEVTVIDLAQDDCGTLYLLGVDASGSTGVYVYDRERGHLSRVLCLDTLVGVRDDGDADSENTGSDGVGSDSGGDDSAAADDSTGGDSDASDERTTTVVEGGDDRWTATALCVTDQHLAVAESTRSGSGRRGRVRVFSRRLRQLRWIADRWESGDTGAAASGTGGDGDTPAESDTVESGSGRLREPVALVADGERLSVLDRGDEDGAGFLAQIGRGGALTVVATGFEQPVDAAIDVGDSGATTYVLDSRDDGSWVSTLADEDDAAGTPSQPADSKVPETTETFRLASLAVVGAGILIGGVDEDAVGEPTLYRWRPGDTRLERIASYRERGERLLVGSDPSGSDDGLSVVDSTGAVWFLRLTARFQRNNRSGEVDGHVVTRLDAGTWETEWHRVRIDFSLAGTGTQLTVAYAATDDPRAVETDFEWQSLRPNPHDALLSDAVGRYLWIRLSLVGTEDASPTVTSFRAYFPRESYLRYLPSIYRDDPESAQFLERFLATFESVFVDIESEITAMTRFLDPQGIPGAYLTWLGSWLAVADDESWPDAGRRQLIAEAPDLFRRRGTREGLRRVIELYLRHVDLEPLPWVETVAHATESGRLYVLEDADLDCIDSPENRATYRTLLSCPQCFVVLVGPGVDTTHVETVQRIVETWSPAHAVGRAVELRPGIQLGSHSYLGVNSALTDRQLVLSESGLGVDSVLTTVEAGAQLGVASRLGTEDGHTLS